MENVIKNKIQEIALHYGTAAQMCKTVEELAELTAEIQRYNLFSFAPFKMVDEKKYTEQVQKIIEETADVEIMLDQIKFLLGIGEDVEQMKFKKIYRQLERMAGESK